LRNISKSFFSFYFSPFKGSSMFRFAAALSDATMQAMEASADTQATLSARVPMFMEAMFLPSPKATLEWNRAWTEKASAVFDGAFAAYSLMNKRMMRSPSMTSNPFDAAETFLAISTAAMRPAQRKVKANAKRLKRS
jgi:hypothetical protein